MALWFTLNINDDVVGTFYAQRRDIDIPDDRICTYDVRMTQGDEQKQTVVRHNFDAGAWALVLTALEALRPIRPEPVITAAPVPVGYGRYQDDPGHVRCPRARSDMTPCIARDGHDALADDGACVGCGQHPHGLDGLLQILRRGVTGRSPAPVTVPGHAADKLRDLVREVTEGRSGAHHEG